MKPNTALHPLAKRLAQWLPADAPEYAELRARCEDLAAFHIGELQSTEPRRFKLAAPLKDSDYFVFCEALLACEYGWLGKAHLHLERVERRMKARPVLVFRYAARVAGVPQVRDGKE